MDWDAFTEVMDEVAREVADAAAKAGPRKTYGGSSIGESAASATGASGRFVFPDVESARGFINDFEDRLESMKKRAKRIERARELLMGQICDDPRTPQYVERARTSLDALDELNESMRKYSANYVLKLNKAIKAMEDIDEQTAHGLRGKGSAV